MLYAAKGFLDAFSFLGPRCDFSWQKLSLPFPGECVKLKVKIARDIPMSKKLEITSRLRDQAGAKKKNLSTFLFKSMIRYYIMSTHVQIQVLNSLAFFEASESSRTEHVLLE